MRSVAAAAPKRSHAEPTACSAWCRRGLRLLAAIGPNLLREGRKEGFMNTKNNVPTALPSTGIRLLRDLLLAIQETTTTTTYRGTNVRTTFVIIIRENPKGSGHRNIGRGSCRSDRADGVERRSTAVVRGGGGHTAAPEIARPKGPLRPATALRPIPHPPPHYSASEGIGGAYSM